MASLSYIVHVLATLFNPISLLLYGHHHQYYSSTSIEHDQSNKVALFVFGDSLFEAGNNGYLPNATAETDPATAWPYGETFFHYSTGRFTDGRIVPDFIGLSRYDGGAEYGKTMQLVTSIAYPASQSPSITKHGACTSITYLKFEESGLVIENKDVLSTIIVIWSLAKYAKLPILPPYLQPGPHDFTDGCNFASGGAGILVEASPEISINLPNQLSFFKDVKKLLQQKLGSIKAIRVLREAVYLISIGGGDYFGFYTNFPNATESLQLERVAVVIGNLSIILQEIYDLGGRKFAFQNVGALGCTPRGRQDYNITEGCVEGLSSLARLHNTALADILKELESQLLGFKYSIFDYYNSLEDRIHNPAKYGFANSTDACCGVGVFRGENCGGDNGTRPYQLCNDVGDYLWFDGGHTTESANIQLAELIWSGTPNVTGPFNVKQLFQQVD